jgi:histidinol-phosphate aminotransferase
MKNPVNRRSMLKSGLMSLGGIALAPHLVQGAFSDSAFKLDKKGRLFYSPLSREYFLDNAVEPKIFARLSSNENPYGPPASAVEAVKESAHLGNRYAGRETSDLIAKMAEKENVKTSQIMIAPGSSDLLEKVALVRFMSGGGNIVSADPTYMSMIRVAEKVGATWKPIPCTSDWSHDLDAMEKAIDSETKLVYICNPNNPVGSMTPAKDLEAFCKRVSKKVPIFLDEAYLELADGPDAKSMAHLVSEGYNVVVCRTFSKIMGMAGLRMGYMFGLQSFIDEISAITRGGFSISVTTANAANAAFGDTAFQEDTKRKNIEAKKYITAELKKMGYDPVPSYTNFMLFQIPFEGRDFLRKMQDKNVGVRSFSILEKTWCRVSIGTMDEMKMFISAMQSIS